MIHGVIKIFKYFPELLPAQELVSIRIRQFEHCLNLNSLVGSKISNIHSYAFSINALISFAHVYRFGLKPNIPDLLGVGEGTSSFEFHYILVQAYLINIYQSWDLLSFLPFSLLFFFQLKVL